MGTIYYAVSIFLRNFVEALRHSFGELKLPSSQTMLFSHCRRKHCSFAMSPQRVEELFVIKNAAKVLLAAFFICI